MTHRVRERAIFALMDGRLGERKRAELERHLAECDACRAFRAKVKATQGVMRQLDAAPLPEVDWRRVDAGLRSRAESARPRPFFGGLVVWGGLAAATAAAFLITLALSGAFDRRVGDQEPATASAPAPRTPVAAPRSLEAFVTFVAGDAVTAGPGEAPRWRALSLDSPLAVGTRLRTSEEGSAGIQIGTTAACRLEPGTDVEIAGLGTPAVQMEVHEGEVRCTSSATDDAPPLVVSVMDVVASASGEARFAVRRQPQIVVIELAEGTLTASHADGESIELGSPERLSLRQGDDGASPAVVERTPIDGEALASSTPDTLSVVPLASLHIPAIDGLERVSVDGVEYDQLPLHLRRSPGSARLELFVAGHDPIVQVLEIGMGPRTFEVASLGALLDLGEQAPFERRVAPRIGTYTKTQVERLSSQVRGRVQRCYERSLKVNPSIWGRINVRFTVSTSGEPRAVKVSSLAGGDRDVNACIEQSIGVERFPPPLGGYIPVEQNITLSPQF
jgi:hypothetical protein